MLSYFYDILEETALPPLQVGVWIPKAKMGPEADNFRPLGVPSTLERLVDGCNRYLKPARQRQSDVLTTS